MSYNSFSIIDTSKYDHLVLWLRENLCLFTKFWKSTIWPCWFFAFLLICRFEKYRSTPYKCILCFLNLTNIYLTIILTYWINYKLQEFFSFKWLIHIRCLDKLALYLILSNFLCDVQMVHYKIFKIPRYQ